MGDELPGLAQCVVTKRDGSHVGVRPAQDRVGASRARAPPPASSARRRGGRASRARLARRPAQRRARESASKRSRTPSSRRCCGRGTCAPRAPTSSTASSTSAARRRQHGGRRRGARSTSTSSSADWRVNANANQGYSLGGLILNVSGKVIANYWLVARLSARGRAGAPRRRPAHPRPRHARRLLRRAGRCAPCCTRA